MTSSIFKEDDTVYLKTGSPAMKVMRISDVTGGPATFSDPNNPKITGYYDSTAYDVPLWVVCKWQENGEEKEESFLPYQLTKEKPSS